MFIGHYAVAFAAKRAVAWSGLLGWLTVAWGYWIDRHRTAVGGVQPRAA